MAADGICEPSGSTPAEQPNILHLRNALRSCSQAVESGDLCKSSQAALELAGYLDSVSKFVFSDAEDGDLQNKSLEVLLEIRGYLCSVDEAVTDAISDFLPKEVAKLSVASEKCLEVADDILGKLIELCGARFMLPILTAAFGYQDEHFHHPRYFAPLLHGVSAVFPSIQRRQYENIKAIVPVILNTLDVVSRDDDIKVTDLILTFERALSVASSIHMVLDGKMHDKLRALHALFILQIMALISISMGHELSLASPLVTQLIPLVYYCGLSYLGCITGSDVEKTSGILFEEDGEINETGCFSLLNHGACLAVIWGHMSNEITGTVNEDLCALKKTLQNNQEKRWQAIGMMKCIFTCNDLSWELKKHGMEFLLEITKAGGDSAEFINETLENSHYITSLYSTLQAVEIVMMAAPDPALRKNAYEALKRILADISPAQRLDVMKALIMSSRSSSMTAILINLVREEMHKEQKRGQEETSLEENGTFWNNVVVLEIVEHVLRPQRGPPSVVKDSDAILSVLNLYRYMLITESTGKSNRTGVLSKGNLRKAYNEWLLPLRALVTVLMAEDSMCSDYMCGLNPVEIVLYRCIEIVEEQMQCSP